MRSQRKVGPDLSYKDLVPGLRLVNKRKGVSYLIVRVSANEIKARFRRGNAGRFSTKLHDLVPAEVIGYVIEQPE